MSKKFFGKKGHCFAINAGEQMSIKSKSVFWRLRQNIELYQNEKMIWANAPIKENWTNTFIFLVVLLVFLSLVLVIISKLFFDNKDSLNSQTGW